MKHVFELEGIKTDFCINCGSWDKEETKDNCFIPLHKHMVIHHRGPEYHCTKCSALFLNYELTQDDPVYLIMKVTNEFIRIEPVMYNRWIKYSKFIPTYCRYSDDDIIVRDIIK